MSDTINLKPITALAVTILLVVPAVSFSRENSLRGGLSVSLDNDNRSYDIGSDDYRRLGLSPMIEFKSLSEKDSYTLRAVPGIKYDLLDSGSDWDANLNVAAERFITKSWQLGFADNYLKSDSQNTNSTLGVNPATPPDPGVVPSTAPQLSENRYRTRYSLNSMNLFSKYIYRENSLFQLGFGYDALRNDNAILSGEDDYDRYTTSLRNEHRYDPRWRSTVELQYIRGNFTPTETTVTTVPTIASSSGDLKEYRLLFELDNQSIIHNPLSLSYNYSDTLYDETDLNDTAIHQMRFTWKRDFSPHLYTRLGIGPSYEKTEGRSANWGENGIAEVNYTLERGFVNFKIEKAYDVDNFSGSNEGGVVDSWNSSLSGSYQLKQALNLTGYLAYIYEDRQQAVILQNSGATAQLDTYQDKQYIAGTTLNYKFWQFYNASIAYTYTKYNSDVAADYDDHRILLTLSWEKEFFRW